MRAIKAKLRSRRGASVTFALLLFTVCAVISAVVIVAASTAGGRLSGVQEMEQRYYAVTAAADALCAELDGQSAIVEYTVDADGKAVASSVTTTETGILDDASERLFSGASFTPIGPVEFTPTSDSNATYTYTITPELNDGILTVRVGCSGGHINKTGVYTLKVIFSSSVKDSVVNATTGAHRAEVTWKFIGLRKEMTGGTTQS